MRTFFVSFSRCVVFLKSDFKILLNLKADDCFNFRKRKQIKKKMSLANSLKHVIFGNEKKNIFKTISME